MHNSAKKLFVHPRDFFIIIFFNFRCAVVTGGNKGIGFEICRQLALNGIEVVLTARNESRGVEAVEKLTAAGIPNVVFHQLDITDPKSIANLLKFIESRFKKLDILVSKTFMDVYIYISNFFFSYRYHDSCVFQYYIHISQKES